MSLNPLLEGAIPHKILASVALLVAVLVLRRLLTGVILRQVPQSELRRRWVVSARNAVVLALIFGLAAIWAEALRTFAYSIVAFAVALVIATKELIQCISGSILRTATNAYSVGDRIEIGSHRGDVIDLNALTTTILEVGPGRAFHLRTGRAIVLPNSKLLDTPVINESFMKQYVVHVFSVPLKMNNHWQEAERILLEAAHAECRSFLGEARRYMEKLERTHSLASLPTQPRIALQISEPGRLNLLVRVPAPVGRQGWLEQAILRRFLEQYQVDIPLEPGKEKDEEKKDLS